MHNIPHIPYTWNLQQEQAADVHGLILSLFENDNFGTDQVFMNDVPLNFVP